MLVIMVHGVNASYSAQVPFSSRHPIATNFIRAESIILADINGNGRLDAVGAASMEGAVAWWENTDDSGTNWMKHMIDASFPSANSVAVSDMDHDGDLDVVAAAGGTNDQVAWWENVDGTGTNWTKHVVDAFFDGARSAATGDVDGDGYTDILAAAFSAGALAWWRNVDGTGTNWQKHTIATGFSGANSIWCADIDRDGHLDAAGAAGSANTIAWWRNAGGKGTNWTLQVIDNTFTGAQSVITADIDGDGDPDVIAAANFIPGKITWWENLDSEGGAWTARVVSTSFSGAYAVHASDIDADGDIDILAAALTADDITWFENSSGNGSAWVTHTVDGVFDGARSVVSGDIDGDGDLDIAAAAFIENQLAWWRNDSIHRTADFCETTVVASGFQGAQSMVAIDRDRDGDLDIISAASVDNRISWFENADGQGGVWLQRIIETNAPNAWSVVAADLNGNGIADVIGAMPGSDTIAWWRDVDGSGINWERNLVDTNFSEALSVAAADINRDGAADIVGASYGSGEISWWHNQNRIGTSWNKHIIDDAFNGAYAVATGDIDGDGKIDVIGAALNSGSVSWWRNDGSATNWLRHDVDAAFNGAIAISIADMDCDGDLDIVGASFDLDRIVWWENVGGSGTNWMTHMIDDDVDGASAVHVADLDQDGDLDVIGGASVINRFAWWENVDGSGNAWLRHDLAMGELDGAAVSAADLDGDGDPDIIGASANASGGIDPNILYWRNSGGHFSLAGTDISSANFLPESTGAVQAISFTHQGRAGDGDVELTSLSFLLEKQPGSALSTAEANSLIETLFIYRDDGSGMFEPEFDVLAAQAGTLSLTGGVYTLAVADNDPQFYVSAESSNTYFLVLAYSASAANQIFNHIRITLLTDLSGAWDRTNDIALNKMCRDGDATSSSTVVSFADIGLVMSGSPNPLELDSNVVFTITITNAGPNSAFGVVVTNAIPSMATYDAAGSSPDCIATGGVVICPAGTLTGNQVRVISVAVQVHGDAVGAITNVAGLGTSSIDSNDFNQAAEYAILLPDTDSDGVADFADPDDDGDGMPDTWELLHSFNRIDSADAALDADLDSFTNLDEYIADTNPHDDASYLRIDAVSGSDPVQILLNSSAARVYTLQFIDQLSAGAWSNVAGQVNQSGTGAGLIMIDATTETNRSYRIGVKLSP